MKWIKTIVTSLLCVAICFVPFMKRERVSAKETKKVIQLWNVDCFEGGTGSRTDFLNQCAKEFSKINPTIFLVTSHTVESAERMVKEGELPDLISYGPSLVNIVPSKETITWAFGKYMVFSFEDNFDNVGTTILSQNNDTLPEIAGRFMGLNGYVEPSLTAYVHFVSGKEKYLLGTQRDYFRLKSSNRNFYYRECNEFTDMIEYLSICKDENELICSQFLDYMMSENVQAKIAKIGLYNADFVGFDETHLPVRFILPMGCGKEGIEDLRKRATSADEKLLKNSLKGLRQI